MPDNPEKTYSAQMLILDTARCCHSASAWQSTCCAAEVHACESGAVQQSPGVQADGEAADAAGQRALGSWLPQPGGPGQRSGAVWRQGRRHTVIPVAGSVRLLKAKMVIPRCWLDARTTRVCGLLSCTMQSQQRWQLPTHISTRTTASCMCNVTQSSASISLQRYRARVLAPAAAIARWHGEMIQCCCLAATAAALSVLMICTRCATRPVATHGRRTCSQSSAHDLLVSYGGQQWGDSSCACGKLCIASIPWSAAHVTALKRQGKHDSHQLMHICRTRILSSCGGGE